MFYLAIIVSLLLDGFSARYWAPNGFQWWFPITGVFFLNGWLPDTINSIVPGGWSIAVEMTFYLVVPILFMKVKGIRSAILLIVFSLIIRFFLNEAAITFYNHFYPTIPDYLSGSMTYFWFFSQLPIFGIGILVFHLFEKYKHVQDRVLGYILLITTLFLFIAFLNTKTYEDLIPQHFLLSIAFGFLTFGLYFSQTKILVNFATCWIGRLSYSMYFIHFLVLRFIESIFPNPLRGSGKLIIGYILVVILTVLISFLTYHLIEKPGIALGKRMIVFLEKRADHGSSLDRPQIPAD